MLNTYMTSTSAEAEWLGDLVTGCKTWKQSQQAPIRKKVERATNNPAAKYSHVDEALLKLRGVSSGPGDRLGESESKCR